MTMKFKEIKWKLRLWWLKLSVAKTDIKLAHLRRRYCRHGIHKISTGTATRCGSNTRTRRIKYLYCAYCKYKFFATKASKDYYYKHFGGWL